MSVLQVRGGFPQVFLASIDNTTGQKHILGSACAYLKARCATNACKMYFTEADYTADQNYVTIPSSTLTTSNVGWEGPVEATAIWLKGISGASSVEIVAFQRRG